MARIGVPALVAVLGFAVAGCKPRDTGGSGTSAAADGSVAAYTGHSDYRLVFVRRPGPAFSPTDDLRQPTPAQQVAGEIADAVRSAALESLIPALGLALGQRSGAEGDLMTALMGLASNAGEALKEKVQALASDPSGQFPLVAEALIVPWTEPTEQLFYDAEKISMNAGAANVLGTSASDDNFPAKLTEAIKTLQGRLYASSPDPWYLLAARQFLFVAPGKSRLTVRVLVGLKPHEAPFSKEDDKVRFRRVVVPDEPGRGIVASATFTVDLEAQGGPPKLALEFGDFKAYEKGDFAVEPSTQQKRAPRMEGEVSKSGASWIALNFSFKKLELDLRRAQISGIQTLLSPGLAVGGANWTMGGLRVESVDQSFQKEINNTIDTQIKNAMTQANDKILDGMMTKELLEQAFRLVFAREGGAS